MDKKRKERNMGKIFKNLIPYWKSVLIIILLLVIQAWCDLALPQYTSDIIDTGIQNSGIEHILPEKIPLDKFRTALNFMTEEEQKDFIDAYNYKSADSDKIVERKELSDEKLKELDDELIIPIIMNYQMSSLPVSTLNKMLKGQNIPEGILNTLEKKTVEKEDEDGNKTKVECVDASPLMAIMIAGSPDSEKTLQNMREQMQKQIDALGTDTLMSSGKAYAKEMDLLAGVDVDEIQTNYLWAAGLRMIVIALILTVAAVLVGFFAARVGAGVGMSLRSKVFKNVIGFSNAEIDKFSTASLITRSTNDIQQIQFVTVMMLRMVLYAPIIGIGGVVKVAGTGASMWWVIAVAVGAIMATVLTLMLIVMPKFKLMQKLVDRVNFVSREILTGIPVIRAFGREKREEERFDEANVALTKTTLFTNRVMTFLMPIMTVFMNFVSVLIV